MCEMIPVRAETKESRKRNEQAQSPASLQADDDDDDDDGTDDRQILVLGANVVRSSLLLPTSGCWYLRISGGLTQTRRITGH